MIKVGELTLFYMNGGESVLVIKMQDGTEHRIKHDPQYLGGVDAFELEVAIWGAKK